MRGKEQIRFWQRSRNRITPAHAGKSLQSGYRRHRSRDHPCACGEKITDETIGTVIQGSPPRMRGKARHHATDDNVHRITPAYAGKSVNPAGSKNGNGDHPRVCGEKRQSVFDLPEVSGSPPRMRGKVLCDSCKSHFLRITPAHAGKRMQSKQERCKTKDHPRTCGEKTKNLPKLDLQLGSPPHMRGEEGCRPCSPHG